MSERVWFNVSLKNPSKAFDVRDCTQITVLIRTKTRRAIYSLFLFNKIVFCLLQIHSFVLALLNSAGALHVQCIYILPRNLFFKELKGYVMHWCTLDLLLVRQTSLLAHGNILKSYATNFSSPDKLVLF